MYATCKDCLKHLPMKCRCVSLPTNMWVLPPHIGDKSWKFQGITIFTFYMLATCRKCSWINNVGDSNRGLSNAGFLGLVRPDLSLFVPFQILPILVIFLIGSCSGSGPLGWPIKRTYKEHPERIQESRKQSGPFSKHGQTASFWKKPWAYLSSRFCNFFKSRYSALHVRVGVGGWVNGCVCVCVCVRFFFFFFVCVCVCLCVRLCGRAFLQISQMLLTGNGPPSSILWSLTAKAFLPDFQCLNVVLCLSRELAFGYGNGCSHYHRP